MSVDPAQTAVRLVHDGEVLVFCSEECAQLFRRNPERYSPRS